jgi:hypothetical protein
VRISGTLGKQAYHARMVKYLRDELDLLLGSVEQSTGELARAVLTEHGIHSMLHSATFESAVAMGAKSRFCQLYVRKGSKAEARRHLEAAWGRTKVDKLVAKSGANRATRGKAPADDESTADA